MDSCLLQQVILQVENGFKEFSLCSAELNRYSVMLIPLKHFFTYSGVGNDTNVTGNALPHWKYLSHTPRYSYSSPKSTYISSPNKGDRL